MSRIVHPRYRVLVVDDGPLNQKLMGGLLSQLGCTVDTVSSGEEALSRTAHVAYDIAFVDLHMPSMDGRETIAALRMANHERNTPQPLMVVLTADDVPPMGDQDWFDLFMSKPVTSGLLRASFDVLAGRTDDQPTVLATAPAVDLIDEFLEATGDAVARMRDWLAKGDFDAIATTAHGVKGTGTSFGFNMMTALGARLEQDARAKERCAVERGLLELEQSLSLA